MAATLNEALEACGFRHRRFGNSYAHSILDTIGREIFRGSAHETWEWLTEFLEKLPTLSVGQADSLKIDGSRTRVWICRVPGETEKVQLEHLEDGRWVKV